MSVKPRTKEELKLMRLSGEMTAKALKKVLSAVDVGVDLITLDKIAEEEIKRLGGQSSFKTVPGYHWTTCLTINSEVVHGIPRPIVLKTGDILSIDLGALYQGWHTDAAWSVVVGKGNSDFLKSGQKALFDGISQAINGKKIGDISSAIQKAIEGGGYSVVRSLVGHGVGKSLHEEPEIPGFGVAGKGLTLVTGMTIAIEAIYTAGKPDVVLDEDGWTISSRDNSLGGLFEMSVIVGEKKAEILTDWRK